jgi:hypothetical protein
MKQDFPDAGAPTAPARDRPRAAPTRLSSARWCKPRGALAEFLDLCPAVSGRASKPSAPGPFDSYGGPEARRLPQRLVTYCCLDELHSNLAKMSEPEEHATVGRSALDERPILPGFKQCDDIGVLDLQRYVLK